MEKIGKLKKERIRQDLQQGKVLRKIPPTATEAAHRQKSNKSEFAGWTARGGEGGIGVEGDDRNINNCKNANKLSGTKI